MPSLPLSYVSPPCINAVYGARIGPSADTSMDETFVNATYAIMNRSVSPGISHGSGDTYESTGEPLCMP